MKIIKKLNLILGFFAVLSLSAFGQNDNNSKIKKTVNLNNFNQIVLDGKINLSIDQNQTAYVSFETKKENLDKIDIKIKDQTLFISSNLNSTTNIYCSFINLYGITGKNHANIEAVKNFETSKLAINLDYSSQANLYVTSNNLLLTATGEGVINFGGDVYNLIIYCSNSVILNADLYAYVINGTIGDDADITLTGETDEISLNIKNDAYLKAFELKTREANINATDYADVCVNANESLYFIGKKESSLYFKGNPKNINKDVSPNAIMQPYSYNKIKLAFK